MLVLPLILAAIAAAAPDSAASHGSPLSSADPSTARWDQDGVFGAPDVRCSNRTLMTDTPVPEGAPRAVPAANDPIIPPVLRSNPMGSSRTLVLFDGVRKTDAPAASPPADGAAPDAVRELVQGQGRTITLNTGGGTQRPVWLPGTNPEEGLYAPVNRTDADGCPIATPISLPFATPQQREEMTAPAVRPPREFTAPRP